VKQVRVIAVLLVMLAMVALVAACAQPGAAPAEEAADEAAAAEEAAPEPETASSADEPADEAEVAEDVTSEETTAEAILAERPWINQCESEPVQGGSITLSIADGAMEGRNWLSRGSTNESFVFSQLVDLSIEDAETFEPDVAESWEISEDGLVYTYNLRDDVVWQALLNSGMQVPEFAATNMQGDKYYDQISYTVDGAATRKTRLLRHGVFDWRNAVYGPAQPRDHDAPDDPALVERLSDAVQLAHYEPIVQAHRQRHGKQPFRDFARSYNTHFMTHEMSDHLPIWIELEIDYSDDYLARFLSAN